MRVLIACECSGRVREALRARGHDAWSCDVLPAEDNSPYHIQRDVLEVIGPDEDWDMMIAFPPCTRLCVSGARWFKQYATEQEQAVEFFMKLANSPIKKIAIENPIGIMSSRWRKPDQIVQPWQFGHGEVKATCLWLKGLPLLQPTSIVSGRYPRIHRMAPGPERSRERSRTFQGIADAIGAQWG